VKETPSGSIRYFSRLIAKRKGDKRCGNQDASRETSKDCGIKYPEPTNAVGGTKFYCERK